MLLSALSSCFAKATQSIMNPEDLNVIYSVVLVPSFVHSPFGNAIKTIKANFGFKVQNFVN